MDQQRHTTQNSLDIICGEAVKKHDKQFCVGYILEFDGNYNMDATEATEVANLVGAKVNVPIHDFGIPRTKLEETFTPEGKLFIEYGSTIVLEP